MMLQNLSFRQYWCKNLVSTHQFLYFRRLLYMHNLFQRIVRLLASINPSSYLVGAIIWLILTTLLSLLSASTVSKLSFSDFVGIDKVGHLIFYATLTYLWYMALRNKKLNINTILFSAIAFGGFMEFCQTTFTEGRVFEWNDLLANILGSLIGKFIYLRFFNS